MKTEILRMLKSTGDYLSGQQLCEMLGFPHCCLEGCR